jgi:hydroxymethylpyrimidine/phosphomethylpyrimidine kinase
MHARSPRQGGRPDSDDSARESLYRADMQARVLVVAGSDSGGGAGIQADIKTVTALGGYASTAITALTAQNTLGVQAVLPVEPDFVGQQMSSVLSDIGADAIKLGMLHSAEVIRVVAGVCRAQAAGIPVILDPVMTAKGGQALLEPEAVGALMMELVPMAALVTPNVPEAELMTGLQIRSTTDFAIAADRLLALGAGAVLIKGGHLPGDIVTDVLRTADGEEHRFEAERMRTRSTHGTGCTLASAIATGIAEGLTLHHAIDRAHRYLLEAIRTAPEIGQGHGPLNHGHVLSVQEKRPNPPPGRTVH